MLASDADLIQLIKDNVLSISPAHTEEEALALIQPASLDLRLSAKFQVPRAHGVHLIDPAASQPGLYEPVTMPPGQPFILHPGQFALGSTYETVSLKPQIAAQVEGKSSLGRLGLMIHSTAGFIDPGFTGQITLEMTNVFPIPLALWPGMAVAQLAVMPVHTPSERPYGAKLRGSHYQGQQGPTTSRSHEGFRIWPLAGAQP